MANPETEEFLSAMEGDYAVLERLSSGAGGSSSSRGGGASGSGASGSSSRASGRQFGTPDCAVASALEARLALAEETLLTRLRERKEAAGQASHAPRSLPSALHPPRLSSDTDEDEEDDDYEDYYAEDTALLDDDDCDYSESREHDRMERLALELCDGDGLRGLSIERLVGRASASASASQYGENSPAAGPSISTRVLKDSGARAAPSSPGERVEAEARAGFVRSLMQSMLEPGGLPLPPSSPPRGR